MIYEDWTRRVQEVAPAETFNLGEWAPGRYFDTAGAKRIRLTARYVYGGTGQWRPLGPMRGVPAFVLEAETVFVR